MELTNAQKEYFSQNCWNLANCSHSHIVSTWQPTAYFGFSFSHKACEVFLRQSFFLKNVVYTVSNCNRHFHPHFHFGWYRLTDFVENRICFHSGISKSSKNKSLSIRVFADFEKKMISENICSEDDINDMYNRILYKIDLSENRAINSSIPSPETIFNYIYG